MLNERTPLITRLRGRRRVDDPSSPKCRTAMHTTLAKIWHKRIYVTCGRDLPAGFVFVYREKDRDHYEFISKVPTGAGAGTSFWVSQLNHFLSPSPLMKSKKQQS